MAKKRRVIPTTMDEEMFKALKKAAEDQCTNVSTIIRQAIKKHLSK